MPLNRARALVGEVAAALGGEAGGRPAPGLRPLDALRRRRARRTVSTRFEALPQIVAVLERDERRVVGVTAEGYPIEVIGATPGELRDRARPRDRVGGYVAWSPARTGPKRCMLHATPLPPPELRELDAPTPPPDLLELGDIRGDLHVHTTASDGKATVEEMGRAAQALGYEYLAICDHTRNVRVVPGLDADDLRRQAEEIAAANEVLAPFRILRGSECDILPDGSLDLPDDVLAELEWVQISLHAGQRWGASALTDRVVEAMRHPAASCLSHPKGRILNHRPRTRSTSTGSSRSRSRRASRSR